jgi:hypothetical protein
VLRDYVLDPIPRISVVPPSPQSRENPSPLCSQSEIATILHNCRRGLQEPYPMVISSPLFHLDVGYYVMRSSVRLPSQQLD